MNQKLSLISSVIGLSLAFASSSSASLLVYEDFNYASSTVAPVPTPGGDGLAYPGGVGLRGSWASGTVGSGSLTYLDGFSSSGNALTINAGANQNNAGPWLYRNMASDPFAAYRLNTNSVGTAGSTLFGSMLVDLSSAGAGDRFWLRLTGNNNTHNHLTIYTADGNDWSIMQINDGSAGATGTSLTVNSAVAGSAETTLLVWQQDFGASSTTLSLWVNPASGAAIGTPNYVFTTAGALSLAGLGYRTGANTATIDEIRIGTTLADVTVIPEPSTFALLAGLVGFGWIIVRRRRS